MPGLGFLHKDNIMRVINLCFVLLYVAFVACSERELPQQTTETPDPEIRIHQVPQSINPGESFFVSVRVLNHETVDLVQLSVYESGASDPSHVFSLYDDGGAEHPEDGDIVAFDGYYSQTILWQPAKSEETEYTFSFQPISQDATPGSSVKAKILSIQKSRPQVLDIQSPALLTSGFDGTVLISARVYDSSGVENLRNVWFEGSREGVVHFTVALNDSGKNGDQSADDQIYSIALDKSFAAGRQGQYELRFFADNKSGAQSDAKTSLLRIENSAPDIFKVSAPDSVERPNGGQVYYFSIKVTVKDSQTIADIRQVQMKWQKPDGSYPQSGPYSELFDNGLAFNINKWNQGYRGDETANDGVYSTTGAFDERQPLGKYTLTFIAYDRVGQASAAWVHSVYLY